MPQGPETASGTVVGILALQGDFEKHRQAFASLGRTVRLVRRSGELADCSHLVIPGGESTTLARLVDRAGLRRPLAEFAAKRPVMGTCAGLIMLGRLAGEDPADHGVATLGLMDVMVQRNGYGRQVDSFTEDLSLESLDGSAEPFAAVYIRAPRIAAVGSGVEVVVRRGAEPVAVRQGNLLGLTFHPELTPDTRVHRAFLQMGA
ncbi:MAG: pyridoxal 5'-phosphate synthase glutaminase subunit PdxT [Candidatus Krumholzibacteriia bacterium]